MTEIEYIRPHPVVESRWKENKYVPEIMTVDGNFVLGKPLDSYEEAMKVATVKAEEIKNAMIATCREFTKHLTRAKI